MHSFLGHTPGGDTDTSPPTSPPSSAAPFSDDEFTTLVLRRAASRLGVEYSPGRWRGHVTGASASNPSGHGGHRSVSQPPVPPSLLRSPAQMPDRDRATLLAMSRTQQLPPPGPQTWALYGDCTVEDIATMIDIRQRALGASHASLVPLYDTMGDRCDVDGQPQVARNHYETALKLMPASSVSDRIGVLAKLGHLMARIGEPAQCAEFLERASRLARSGKESVGDSNEPLATAAAAAGATEPDDDRRKREDEERRVEHLQTILLSGADSQEARRDIAESLLRLRAPQEAEPATVDVGFQTDDTRDGGKHRDDAVTLPPQRQHLSDEQLARIRAPTSRSTADLRSLLSYVADRRKSDASVTEATAASIDAIRKRMAIPTAARRAAATREAAGTPFASPAHVPCTGRLDASVHKLTDVMDRLRTQPTAQPSATESDHNTQRRHMSPAERTEREVARMLLESSLAASPERTTRATTDDLPNQSASRERERNKP